MYVDSKTHPITFLELAKQPIKECKVQMYLWLNLIVHGSYTVHTHCCYQHCDFRYILKHQHLQSTWEPHSTLHSPTIIQTVTTCSTLNREHVSIWDMMPIRPHLQQQETLSYTEMVVTCRGHPQVQSSLRETTWKFNVSTRGMKGSTLSSVQMVLRCHFDLKWQVSGI